LPKILLHTCCGPCTIYAHQKLTSDGFEVNGFFYNPNIRPRVEYERRKQTMDQYAKAVGLPVLYAPNDQKTEPGACENCYRIRLNKTAQKAKELGFNCFSTTLLISPYQKHDLLKQIGTEIGQKYGINFYYEDFRVGFRPGQQLAREMKLYRQKYCGCEVPSDPEPVEGESRDGVKKKEPEYAKIN